MLDISFGELAIIFTLCLLVLGPEKLPKLASQLGRLAGQARAMARHFRTQLEQEVQHEQMMKELRESDAQLSKVLAQARENPLEALASLSEVSNKESSDKTADTSISEPQAQSPNQLSDQSTSAEQTITASPVSAFQYDDPDFDPTGAIGRDAANANTQTPADAAESTPINKPAA